jgi:serine/threonine protein kinase
MSLVPGESRIGNYVIQNQLGSGTFATVWRATHVLTKVSVAIKVISKNSVDDDDAVTRLTRELNFMKQMRHPFIAEFYEHLEDDDAHYYCMEYAENNNILHFITTNGPLSENQGRHYFSQLISVLDYLHTDLRVCHRDLKAENLLLDRHNNIRVIDFGLSNQFNSVRPLMNTACGSPPYASPEMIKGNPYSQAADIWSSGIVLYSMLTGMLPFDDDNLQTLLRKIVTQDVTYPSFLSPALIDLLRRMLTKNPELRITLPEIKEHDWFSQTQYEALFALNLSERETEAIVESDLVEQMAQMGIETASLRQQLMLGASTELTAMYRMLRRQRLTDVMRDQIARLLSNNSRVLQGRGHEAPKAFLKVRPVGMTRTVAAQTPMPRQTRGASRAPGQPEKLIPPSSAPVPTRRFSRPLAMNRLMPARDTQRAPSDA